MKTCLVFTLIFALTGGLPKDTKQSVTALFQEWRGLVDELPVGEVLKKAAHDEVNDLFIRVITDRDRGLFTSILTYGLDESVKKEFEESVSLFADNTGKWFEVKVKSVAVGVTLNLKDKLKNSAIALKNKVVEFVGGKVEEVSENVETEDEPEMSGEGEMPENIEL